MNSPGVVIASVFFPDRMTIGDARNWLLDRGYNHCHSFQVNGGSLQVNKGKLVGLIYIMPEPAPKRRGKSLHVNFLGERAGSAHSSPMPNTPTPSARQRDHIVHCDLELHKDSRLVIEGTEYQAKFGGARIIDAYSFSARFPDVPIQPNGFVVGQYHLYC